MIVLLFVFARSYSLYTIPSVTVMPSMSVCKQAVREIKAEYTWTIPKAYCTEVKK